ncbi:hypothetical protein AR457_01660 [Streptomyces agglomeratus]|uniref:DNA-binding phage zinc finger domain-containing protein n=1 Tax=Streptomyces agglomeratus TaxID=285458 RepID=A0A1E5P1M9_9ACTN|nr:hypothetical protein [Streptomyces agglomeratus]OEJ23412.1 hypothetical protein AS594_01810 [Streptomyces agglomeratus]OEJ42997.1 hypothetical protein AR457_01660 [Streptomyces agglomeratus]OEJ55081.1 hypothetical protein BGK72_34085 [Streptomyces agglomeratus]OEJ62443.1 hypothetical protein BGM19_35020 [Streptomyces agglomeratus]
MQHTDNTTTAPALDSLYETLRLYQHGPFSVACPDCHVKPGQLCLARRVVHRGRRRAYRSEMERVELVPLLAAAA